MKVTLRVARWTLDGRGAARGRTERTAILVDITLADARTGTGEAAPLPGLSIDTLAEAQTALAAFAAAPPPEPDDFERIAVLAREAAPASPSARFALETALVSATGIEPPCIHAATLAPSVLVDDATDAARAHAAGARVLKVKVGPDADADLVRAIARAAPGARLRLDANRAWPRAEVPGRLAGLADLPIDYVEEPCLDANALLDEPLAIPIALDESLATLTPDALARALASPSLAALILKPTLLGGLSACLELARAAAAHGTPVLVTHALESPIGRAACEHALRPRSGQEGSAPVFCVAHPGPDTVAAIVGAFAAHAPIALLHPRATADEQARQRALVEAARLEADDAVIMFTSGSTGAPRGVVLSRAAIEAAVAASAAQLAWRAEDRALLALSTAHAGGLAVVARCLAAGTPIVHVAREGDRAALAAALAECTIASLVPTQLAQLLDDPSWHPPPMLRAVLVGGAAAAPTLLAAAAARGVPFLTTYGLTETFGQIATAPLTRAGDPAAPLVPLPSVVITAGTRAAPAPIRVRAPMLATRYLDGTPIAPELVTADLGFLDDGALHVCGRGDDVIITGGENVHPAEIEAVLAATPGVRHAIAFGVPDERWGQIIAAAIEIDERFDEPAAARAWRDALARHACPRELAPVAALPVLPTGKLDRLAARALARHPVHYAPATSR